MTTSRSAAAAALTAFLLLATQDASWGGGSHAPVPPPPPWDGPGDTVPAGGGGGAPSGPSTPAPAEPGAPSRPGPSSSGAAGRTRRAELGPQAPAAPSTPAGVELPDLSEWTWWWNFNRDPYLDLKRQVQVGETTTSSDDFYLGHGQSARRSDALPDAEARRTLIGPALLASIDAGSYHLQGDALLALAKLYPDFAPDSGSTRELLVAYLRDASQQKAEAAIAALGVLGDPAAAQDLLDLAADNARGRELVGRRSVAGHSRPVAAFALGVLGAQLDSEWDRLRIVNGLQALLREPMGAAPDLHVACVTALGLVPLAAPGELRPLDGDGGADPLVDRARQVRFLVSLLLDEDRHVAVRAHAPKAIASLARTGSRELADAAKRALLDELAHRGRSERHVSFGLVEALGMLGDGDDDAIDRDVRAALQRSVDDGNNSQSGLSLVALALASSRRGQGEAPLAGLPATRKYLLGKLARGKSRQRPWAALALGLQEYHALRAGEAASEAVRSALLATNEDVRAPLDSGAWSLALGLCGDERAVDALVGRLERSADDEARGYAAIGLGLLGSTEAVPALQRVLETSRHRDVPLRKAATALVLLGRRDVVDELLEIVAEEKTANAKGTGIAVLGLVGDRRIVAPLVAVLADEHQLDITRAYAATALGLCCEREPLPWTASIANHVNYLANTETMLSADGQGILNLR
ncbi:MAG: HEAT repeat domain-containing protein [Planctomycetes bacterium]|nr:HEAT repeat domain-containing protein [Planctomycetota bacterium]